MFFVSCSRVRYDPTDGDIDDSIIASLPSSTSSYVSSDSVCSLIANKSGWFGMYCGGYFVGDLYNALDSSNSKNNGACTMEDNAKGDGYDVYCSGKKQGELHNGEDGLNGRNGIGCSVDDASGGYYITCGNDSPKFIHDGKDGESCGAFQDSVTGEISVSCGGKKVGSLHNGADGESCELRDNAKGDGYDVYCGGKKQGDLHNGNDGATGQNGSDGADGVGCTATPTKNGDIEMTCGKNGTPVTLQKGEKGDAGTSCKVVPATDPSHDYEIQCADGTHEYVDNGKGCKMDKGTGFSVITCGAVSDTFYVNPGNNAICGFDSTAVAYNTLKKKCFNDRIVSEFGEMTDTRDGKVYKTVYFRDLNQTWMAENLNYLPTDSIGICPMNSQDSCEKYGRLYNWIEAVNYDKKYTNCTAKTLCNLPQKVQGVCPDGWHLPDSSEFNGLLRFADKEYMTSRNLGAPSKPKYHYYRPLQKGCFGSSRTTCSVSYQDEFGLGLLAAGVYTKNGPNYSSMCASFVDGVTEVVYDAQCRHQQNGHYILFPDSDSTSYFEKPGMDGSLVISTEYSATYGGYIDSWAEIENVNGNGSESMGQSKSIFYENVRCLKD